MRFAVINAVMGYKPKPKRMGETQWGAIRHDRLREGDGTRLLSTNNLDEPMQFRTLTNVKRYTKHIELLEADAGNVHLHLPLCTPFPVSADGVQFQSTEREILRLTSDFGLLWSHAAGSRNDLLPIPDRSLPNYTAEDLFALHNSRNHTRLSQDQIEALATVIGATIGDGCLLASSNDNRNLGWKGRKEDDFVRYRATLRTLGIEYTYSVSEAPSPVDGRPYREYHLYVGRRQRQNRPLLDYLTNIFSAHYEDLANTAVPEGLVRPKLFPIWVIRGGMHIANAALYGLYIADGVRVRSVIISGGRVLKSQLEILLLNMGKSPTQYQSSSAGDRYAIYSRAARSTGTLNMDVFQTKWANVNHAYLENVKFTLRKCTVLEFDIDAKLILVVAGNEASRPVFVGHLNRSVKPKVVWRNDMAIGREQRINHKIGREMVRDVNDELHIVDIKQAERLIILLIKMVFNAPSDRQNLDLASFQQLCEEPEQIMRLVYNKGYDYYKLYNRTKAFVSNTLVGMLREIGALRGNGNAYEMTPSAFAWDPVKWAEEESNVAFKVEGYPEMLIKYPWDQHNRTDGYRFAIYLIRGLITFRRGNLVVRSDHRVADAVLESYEDALTVEQHFCPLGCPNTYKTVNSVRQHVRRKHTGLATQVRNIRKAKRDRKTYNYNKQSYYYG